MNFDTKVKNFIANLKIKMDFQSVMPFGRVGFYNKSFNFYRYM